MTTPLLEVRKLSISFNSGGGTVTAVRDLDFTLEAADTLAIVGASGAGKSVTAQALLGLVPGNARLSGEILFDGRNLLSLPAGELQAIRGRQLAMVFQDPVGCLNPVLPVGEQVAEVLRCHLGLDRGAARRRAVELLREVQIPDAQARASDYPHQLSGGMCQRVMLAGALAGNPRLLVADEPTTSLDVIVQAGMLSLIRDIQSRREMALVFITHDMALVPAVARRVLVMSEGRKVEEGEAGDVLSAPTRKATRALLEGRPPSAAGIGGASGAARASRVPLLAIRDLVVEYPLRRGFWRRSMGQLRPVDHVSLDLQAGRCLGLVGQSGCGKTTLGLAAAGMVSAGSGDVIVKGRSLGQLGGRARREVRRSVQMIFQDFSASLDPRWRVRAILAEAAAVGGRTADEDGLDALCREMELPPETLNRYPHELSGGQRQRVAVIRALAARPDVIIADEPATSLDAPIRSRVLNLLRRAQQRRGLGLLLISHDLQLIASVCDDVAVMYFGQIVELISDGGVDDALHPCTRALVDAAPTLQDSLAGALPRADGRSIPSWLQPGGGCPFVERCDKAIISCQNELPQLREIAAGHFLRCPVMPPAHN